MVMGRAGGPLLRAVGYATYPLSKMGVGRSKVIRAGWRLLAKSVVGEITTVSIQGLRLQIVSRDLFAMNILLRGGWETYELQLFRSLIRPGMTVVDVGAHVGLYSLVAASALGESGRVVAFEPEPVNHELLLRNIEANGFANVTAVRKAVSDKRGTLDFYLDETHSTLHSLRPLTDGQAPSTVVDVTSLDEFFGCEQVDLIKMDVEGVEGGVLDGMRSVLDRNPGLKLFTEFNPTFLRAAGTEPAEFLSRLISSGFSLYEISASERRTIPFDEVTGSLIPPGEGIDLLCAR